MNLPPGTSPTSDLEPGTQKPTPKTLELIANSLHTRGYVILPNALPSMQLDALFAHYTSLDQNVFNRAGIGHKQEYQLNRFVRTDEICWLNGDHPTTRAYLDWAETLRLGLNERLYLGLFDYECHYAFYPPGAYYKRHLDAFQGDNLRRISSILYLNPQWQPGDGGELLLFHPDRHKVLECIQPSYGKLVLFLSEEFPHEVLPSKIRRRSIAGWFRINGQL